MQVVIIGSGNVGTALGYACHRAQHTLLQVYSRNDLNAGILASAIDAQPVSDWSRITPNADLYLVALPDALLASLHTVLRVEKGCVVHTAGAIPMSVLSKVSHQFGVLYPLQSLHKSQIGYPDIPLLIDGNTDAVKTLIMDFAATLSGRVAFTSDEERLKLHVAAVWVNNFTNHLYAIAGDLCGRYGVDFSLLQPMIEHTANRLHYGKPADFQTGPARRGDNETMEAHLKLMEGFPDYQALYTHLSKSIAAGF